MPTDQAWKTEAAAWYDAHELDNAAVGIDESSIWGVPTSGRDLGCSRGRPGFPE